MRSLLLAACMLLASAAPAVAAEWTRVSPTNEIASPPQWQCLSSVPLNGRNKEMLAVCRRELPRPSAELQLLQIEAGSPPRSLLRLADASQAALHLFVSPDRCTSEQARGKACVDTVLLLDQWDESSCYGSQVLVRTAGKGLRKLGFIDEWRPDGDQAKCIGPWARVLDDGAGTRINLPGPLARTRPDGSAHTLSATQLTYRVDASVPSMRRLAR